MKRFPWFTAGVCGAALLAWFMPGLADRWVYDRQAILGGEIWRLLSGHLVHFSPSHLVLDAAALALAGSLCESRFRAPRRALFLAVPIAISLALLFGEPNMARYGGLSGLAAAAMVYVALHLVSEGRLARTLGLAALAGMAAKVTVEWSGSAPLFATVADPSIIAAPLSHAVGAGMALLLFGIEKAGRQTGNGQTPARVGEATASRHDASSNAA